MQKFNKYVIKFSLIEDGRRCTGEIKISLNPLVDTSTSIPTPNTPVPPGVAGIPPALAVPNNAMVSAPPTGAAIPPELFSEDNEIKSRVRPQSKR